MIGSCSQFCLILQLHRVAVPFPPTFASPWRNSFVQIHGRTPLLKAKFGTTPQKRPKNDLNWGVGSFYCTNKPPLRNPWFSYEIIVLATKFESPYQNWEFGEGFPHQDLVRGWATRGWSYNLDYLSDSRPSVPHFWMSHPDTKGHITANPTWGDIFECCFKAQSSKLERLFSLRRGKRDFELGALSFRTYHPKWDCCTYLPSSGLCLLYSYLGFPRTYPRTRRFLGKGEKNTQALHFPTLLGWKEHISQNGGRLTAESKYQRRSWGRRGLQIAILMFLTPLAEVTL